MTYFHIIMLEVQNRLRACTRVATFMFQSALSLKNRLRSRTRVAIPMFDNAAGQSASRGETVPGLPAAQIGPI